jgi:hypothetical protein
MKITLKLLALIASLGILFYLFKNRPKEQTQQIEYITIASEQKSPELPTAKPLYSAPNQNYLEVGNNINSKR